MTVTASASAMSTATAMVSASASVTGAPGAAGRINLGMIGHHRMHVTHIAEGIPSLQHELVGGHLKP